MFGYEVDKYYYIGFVFVVIFVGLWYYKEYLEYVNMKGFYFFELVYFVYILMVLDINIEEMDVWFVIYGVNVNLDKVGNVMGIFDV